MPLPSQYDQSTENRTYCVGLLVRPLLLDKPGGPVTPQTKWTERDSNPYPSRDALPIKLSARTTSVAEVSDRVQGFHLTIPPDLGTVVLSIPATGLMGGERSRYRASVYFTSPLPAPCPKPQH